MIVHMQEAMRALPIEDEAAYGQSDKRMCQLINIRGTSMASPDTSTDKPVVWSNTIIVGIITGIVFGSSLVHLIVNMAWYLRCSYADDSLYSVQDSLFFHSVNTWVGMYLFQIEYLSLHTKPDSLPCTWIKSAPAVFMV